MTKPPIMTPAEALKLHRGAITQDDLAQALGVSRFSINQLENGRRGITPEMALRLAAAFGGTTPEYWLDIQRATDLAEARKSLRDQLRTIRRLT